MSSSLFSSFQENTKCESTFFADTCTCRVHIFLGFERFFLADFRVIFLRFIRSLETFYLLGILGKVDFQKVYKRFFEYTSRYSV